MKIFHLSEPKHGWIDVTFGEPPDAFTLTASDVPNDCLRDLAAATSRLLRNPLLHEVVEFSLEPGFLTCELHGESDLVRVVLRHPGIDGAAFDESLPLVAFARRVRFELLRIKPLYATEGGWTQPFPEREVANLG